MAQRTNEISAAAQLAGLMLIGAIAWARADGAIAVGSSGDVVKHGIAFGMVIDVPLAQALETAISRCRQFQAREAAKYCKVVATFSRECYSVAYDPSPGTPGAGWGVGKDQNAANQKSLAMCRDTAGAGREQYCRVESAGCDSRN